MGFCTFWVASNKEECLGADTLWGRDLSFMSSWSLILVLEAAATHATQGLNLRPRPKCQLCMCFTTLAPNHDHCFSLTKLPNYWKTFLFHSRQPTEGFHTPKLPQMTQHPSLYWWSGFCLFWRNHLKKYILRYNRSTTSPGFGYFVILFHYSFSTQLGKMSSFQHRVIDIWTGCSVALR